MKNKKITFSAQEIDLLAQALNNFYTNIKVDCIYCESVFKDTNNEIEKKCRNYKALEDVKEILFKIGREVINEKIF